jgi:hypothetical protein
MLRLRLIAGLHRAISEPVPVALFRPQEIDKAIDPCMVVEVEIRSRHILAASGIGVGRSPILRVACGSHSKRASQVWIRRESS